MSEITRYPLCWPNNVARRAPHQRLRAHFKDITITQSTQLLLAEINRLNGNYWTYQDESVIISTNVNLRLDGLPRGGQGEPPDTGVAVYFQLKFAQGGKWHLRPLVMSCDKWTRVAWNLYAIMKDIEAQRARARYGCGSIQQAFQGYVAIPEKCGGDSWWTVLGIQPAATREQVEAAYKARAQTEHPDKGGSQERWLRLQNAYEQAKQ